MNENFNHKIISDEEARIIYQKYKKEGFKPVISENRESPWYKSLPKNATKEEILEDLENITQALIKAIEDGGDEFNEEDSFFITPDISGGM